MVKAAIYCRLSKEDEYKQEKEHESESIQNQKQLLTEYAVKNNWQIYKIFADDDYSGLYEERPAFEEMIREAEKGLFQIILCKSQSRFSRNMEVIEKYIHGKFILWGIRFVSITDNVDTELKGNKKARQINGLVNEWYSEDLSENVKAALYTKKKNGQYLGHWCAYGYKLDPNDRHKIVIDYEAAENVKKIYSLYAQGYGISAVAKIMTDKKCLTPTAYKHSKGINYYNPSSDRYSEKYGIWSVNTIRRILRDKTYTGVLVQGREIKPSYKSKKVIKTPESSWIVVENNHEPIIDKETFNSVQKRIATQGSNFKNGGKIHIFAGKAKCMACGGNMQKNHGKNGVLYLRCALAVKTKQKECVYHTIRLDSLTAAVEKRIKDILKEFIKEETWEKNKKMILESQNKYEKEIEFKEKLIHETKAEKEFISDKIVMAYNDRAKGILSENAFIAISKSAEEQIRICERKTEEIEKKIEILKNKYTERKDEIKNIESCIDSMNLDREIVEECIDYIEIGEKEQGQQKINVYWRF
jgi:site-specific DNA recombinase